MSRGVPQRGNLHLKATEPLTESRQHEAHFERPTAFVSTSLQLPLRGLDPLLLLVQREEEGGEWRKTSWLCVWVRVAVSKVLCYVCHSWAGLSCLTTLLPPSTNPNKPLKPPTLSHIPLYQRHYWSKTLNALWSKSSTTTIDLAFYSFCM